MLSFSNVTYVLSSNNLTNINYEIEKNYRIIIFQNGSLSGYVNDSSHNPIEGALVSINCGGLNIYNITDSDGFYYIGDVPIVDCYWNVSASKKGYDTSWFDMPIDNNYTYNFVLTILSDIIFVGGNGPNNYSRIQDAVDNASDDDTVYVYNGTYYENVGIRKSISLVGEDRNITIIDGLNKSSVINVGARGVTIEKFTIRNGTNGIEGWCNNFTILSNIIVNNEKGIKLSYSENNNITYNIIKENNYGITFYESKNSVISYNIILLNKKIGILFTMATMPGLPSENNTVYKNIIKQNTVGILLEYSSLNKINCNNFYENILDASFRMSSWTNWNNNYWGRTRIFPKPIFGFWLFSFVIFNFDWLPAKEPYDIT